MRSRRILGAFALGLAVLGAGRFVSARNQSAAAVVASSSAYAAAPATATKVDTAAAPRVAEMETSSTPQIARVRVIVKGRIDESRLAALQVDVVERRGNGQLVLLVPADRLDALRALPGDFTTRVSTPVNAL